MYKVLESYFCHKDERGSIKGIINSGNWQEINYITSKKGCIRGGHYHKKTTELFYILKGSIKAVFEKEEQKQECKFSCGDIFLIEPETFHTFEMLEDSEWINMLSIRMDNNSPDIYK
ncbi:MAG: cupin domain-containing protein [Clostridium sp.]|nr:cupin domain-containing protein [Clostridium sp.]